MSHHDHSGSFHEEEASFAGADFSKVALSPHRRIAAAEIGHRSTARRPIGTVPEPPRYQMIAYDLEEEIRDGYRPIGGMLPTEAELVQRFDVSRFTVREALRQLERLGLIKRRQGAGTIVVSRAPAERFTQKLQSLDQLLQYAPSHLHVATLRKVRLTRNDARLLQTGHRETWLRADGVRRSAGTGSILCAATLWLRPEFASVLHTNAVMDGSVHARIERAFGVRIEHVDVELDCDVLTAHECKLLRMVKPVPTMRVSRRYSDIRNRTLQVSRDTHLADRFNYRMNFQRDS